MKQMTRMMLTFGALLLLVLAGCSNNKPTNDPVIPDESTGIPIEDQTDNTPGENGTVEDKQEATDELTESEIPMRDFFLAYGSKAHYKGDGNEFAELNIEVIQPYENYVIVYEDNGGASLQKIYKIGTNNIEILAEDMIEFDPIVPSLEQLEEMKPIGVYLQQPFTVGTKFQEWTIVEINATVETPYKTFDNVIVIEMAKDDYINRKYFVQGSGEVKREAIMKIEGEEDFIVTSTLESIE